MAKVSAGPLLPGVVTKSQSATASAESLMPANLTAGQFGGNETISRSTKLLIGDRLQSAIQVVENEYHYHMNRHRYSRSHQDGSVYHMPSVLRGLHTGRCLAHEAGMVRVYGVPYRGYCFGAAAIEGPRVCDCRTPNYKKMIGQEPYGVQKLYGQSFAIRPYVHRSRVTAANGDYLKTAVHIISQGTLDRLPHLQTLLSVWKGPISFAVLLPSVHNLTNLAEAVEKSKLMQQYVDIHAVWRLDGANDPAAFYPINMLRNIPLQLLPNNRKVFVLDIDVVPSAPMEVFRDAFVHAANVSKTLPGLGRPVECPGLTAVVPPAVNMAGRALQQLQPLRHAEKGIAKVHLVERLLSGAATPMHLYFGPAYGPTDHYKWMKSDEVVEIPYLTRFEPYYLTTTPVPLFNETFVNRGGNKAQQAMEMAAGGYRFYRMPRLFVVDVPHAHEPDRPDADEAANKELAGQQANTPNADAKNGTQSAVAIKFSNPTSQKVFDKGFIRDQWSAFFGYLPHRYRYNMPSPQSNDPAFRQYRRVYQRLMSLLWGTLGAPETPSLVR